MIVIYLSLVIAGIIIGIIACAAWLNHQWYKNGPQF